MFAAAILAFNPESPYSKSLIAIEVVILKSVQNTLS